MEDSHTHGDVWFTLLGITTGMMGSFIMNEYVQTAIHGAISGGAGALAALTIRFIYKRYFKKPTP